MVIDARTLWLFHRQIASPGCGQPPANFCAPPRLLPACASVWQSLLGMLSSLSHLVPGGRLQMRSLQICLHRSWDRLDPSAPVVWSPDCLRDLRWWLHGDRRSVRYPRIWTFGPTLQTSAWGAHLGDRVVSGLWDQPEALLPVNARELLAVRRGLLRFQSFLSGTTVAVFCDNVTAVAYLRKEGGTRSPALNTIAQEILRWAESLQIRLAPQFIPGIRNVLADTLSRPHQLPSSEWPLNMDVFRSLTRQWPVMIDLFATSNNHRSSIYFSPFRDPLSAGTDALLQSWDGLLAYAFPPWSILPQVGEASGVPPDPPHPSHPLLASASVVRGPPTVVGGSSSGSSCSTRPPLPATVSSALPGSPQAVPSCLETIQRFTRAAGFSSVVAAQASLSRSNYQLKWSVYRSWCRSQGHSISRPSLSKVVDFLWWLRSVRGLSVSSIKGYGSMLSAVFRFHLPALSAHPVLRDLLHSFRVSAPSSPMRPPSWDLSKVLRFLISGAFEPLHDAPLRALSKKVLFLLALGTAKRVGELQALSRIVSFVGGDACLLCSGIRGQVWVAFSFHPSRFLGQVIVEFCGGPG